ncbi:alpha/beta fold hydrolase [Rhizobium brockwellii]|uniref:alpha/beta fold hydrolase n=1 Tax=Rhizobium TaxID=379 RepID=UPI003F949914
MMFQWEQETLHYAAEGEGPALVLLHGLGGKADNWLLQRRFLSRTHKVLSLDLPGHGSSTGHSVHFRDFWRAVEAMLDHASVKQASLCGLSAGGRLGLDFAAHRPARVTSLVIVNAFVSMLEEDRLSRLAMYELLKREDGRRLWAEELLRFMGLTGDTAIERGFLKSVEKIEPLQIRRLFREQEQYDQRPQLSELNCPVLIVRGAKDDLVPGYCAHEIAERSNGKLVVMGTGHLPYLEAPDAFNRHLTQFLAGDA